jgi:toxin ParE1/3/4
MGSQRYAHLLPDRSLRMWQLDHFLTFSSIVRAMKPSVCCALHERRALSADSLSY